MSEATAPVGAVGTPAECGNCREQSEKPLVPCPCDLPTCPCPDGVCRRCKKNITLATRARQTAELADEMGRLRKVLRLIQQGNITPPMVGYCEAWLWHDNADHDIADDDVEMLYIAKPDLAAAIAKAIGWPGTLDVIEGVR